MPCDVFSETSMSALQVGRVRALSSPVFRGTALATAVSTVGVLPAYLAGALAPQIREDLGIGPAAVGLALSACFLSQSLFSARLGRIVDRLGAITSLRAAALATAVVAGTIAAPARSFAVLVVVFFAARPINSIAPPPPRATGAASGPPRRPGGGVGGQE